MSFYLSKKSIEKLKFVHPNLVLFIGELIKISPYDFRITHGVRTAEEQNKLYQQGRITSGNKVTNCDGYKIKSNHQLKDDGLGYAIDIFCLANGGTWVPKYYEKIAEVARPLMKKYSIKWGGDWKNKDLPHFEYKI